MPITSRCRNADGSSIAQTQKLRRKVSAGLDRDVVPRAVHRVVLAHVLEPVEEAGDPTDPAFGQADPQLGEPHRDARVQPVDRGEHRVPEEQHADGVGRRVG